MIGWLRREAGDPVVEVAGRTLPIAVRRDPRARRLTLRLAADGSEVRLTLPRWCPEAEAIAFAHARSEWLGEQLAKIPVRRPPEPGGSVMYRGRELAIDWRAAGLRTPRLDGERIVLGGPLERVAARVQRWLEREAQELMEEDMAFYAARAAIPVPRLRLTRAQRRWGSWS